MKKISFFVITIFFSSSIISCHSSNGVTNTNLSFPIGIRAMKKKIQPPAEFVAAIFQYQKEKGHWPVSESVFEAYALSNRKIFNNFYNQGFLSWQLGEQSLDSLQIHFVHEPVYTQTIGTFAFEGREVKLKTTFVASIRTHTTQLKKNRH